MPPPLDGTGNPVAPEEWWQRLARIGAAAGKSSTAPTRASMNYDIGRNVGSIIGGLRKPKQPGVVSTQAKDPTIPPQSTPPGIGSSAQATNFVAPNTQQFDPTSQQLYGQVDEYSPQNSSSFALLGVPAGTGRSGGSSPIPNSGGGGGSSANTPPFWPGQTWNYDPWGDPSSGGYGGDNGPTDITVGIGDGYGGGGGTGREDENPDQWDYEYMATGGEADQPTPVIIGEGGEEEFVVPKSKLKGFAASVEAGKPVDPKLLPSDDRGYSPVPDSMRQAMGGQLGSAPPAPPPGPPGPPAMPMGANGPAPPPPGPPVPPAAPAGMPPGRPGLMPSDQFQLGGNPAGGEPPVPPPPMRPPGEPPRMGTPGQAPQLPDVPQRKPPGILQRLGAAAIGGLAAASNAKGTRAPQIDASGAERAILAPGYDAKMASYQTQMARVEAQSKLNKEAAETEEARSRGGYYAGENESRIREREITAKARTDAATEKAAADRLKAGQEHIDRVLRGRAEDAIYTRQGDPRIPADYDVIQDPNKEGMVYAVPPAFRKMTEDLAPYLPGYKVGDVISHSDFKRAQTAANQNLIAGAKKTDPKENVNSEYAGVVREFTDPSGQTNWAKANAEYDRRLAQRARESRPPAAPGVALTSPAVDQAAQLYIQTGQMPSLGMGSAGAQARQAILNRAGELGGDVAGNKQEYRAQSGSLAGLQRQSDQTEAFARTATANLDIANGLSKQVDRTGSPLINRWVLAAKGKITGDPDTRKFQAAVQTAANEYAKVVTNNGASGSVTDSARREYETILNASDNPQAFDAVVKMMKQEMDNRRAGFSQQLQDIRSRRPQGEAGATGVRGGGPGTPPPPANGGYLRYAAGASGHQIGQKADGGWYDTQTGAKVQ